MVKYYTIKQEPNVANTIKLFSLFHLAYRKIYIYIYIYIYKEMFSLVCVVYD